MKKEQERSRCRPRNHALLPFRVEKRESKVCEQRCHSFMTIAAYLISAHVMYCPRSSTPAAPPPSSAPPAAVRSGPPVACFPGSRYCFAVTLLSTSSRCEVRSSSILLSWVHELLRRHPPQYLQPL
ncbi:hypothetical protein J6590_081841 [Homalodisca vitripennis]|nr:hypothetical protein J6590_081841 [Homalodisca vitripennis]